MKPIKQKGKVLDNSAIIKGIFSTYVFSKPFVRYFCFIILFSTFIASLLEIFVANTAKELTKKIQESQNINSILSVNTLVLFAWTSISMMNRFVFSIPVQRVYRLTCKNIFEKCIKLELGAYSHLGSGEIQTVIDRESKAISELVEVSFLNIIPIVFAIILTSYNVMNQLGLVILCIIMFTVALFIVSTIAMVHWRTKIRHDYNLSQQICSNVLQDSLINHETILSYKKEEYETVKYSNAVSAVEKDCNRLWISLNFMFMVNKLTFVLQIFLVILASSYEWYTTKLTGPNFSLYLTTNKLLFANLGQLGFFYSRFTQAIMNVKTSFEEVEDDHTKDVIKHNLEESIDFKDVSFYYEYNMILEDINFKINKGEKVAIVGKNGAGKSTIIKMLMKFESYTGEINFDGVEIRNITDLSYRSLISYVPQTSFLFNDTVEYNIMYGNKNVKVDEAYEICKRIGVHDSITRLDDGYQTKVGDKGSLLSGGERQKILLVRAVLKNSPIFIMDEPTAALDKHSEEAILKFILNERKDSTVVMILHNLELIKLFDKVLHVKDKKVIMESPRDDNLFVNL